MSTTNWIIVIGFILVIAGVGLIYFSLPKQTEVSPDNSEIMLQLAQKIDSLARFRDTEKIIFVKEKLQEAKNEITTANDSVLLSIFWREYFSADSTGLERRTSW